MPGDVLRVGLDLLGLGERAGGVGTYARELAAALAARADVDLTLLAARDTPPAFLAAGARVVRVPAGPIGSRRRLAAEYAGLGAVALARRLDVLHGVANAGPVGVPGVACVVTLHDLIWHHHAEDWGTPAAAAAMRRIAIPTARRARRVVCDSEHAAGDIAAVLGVDRARIDPIPLGVRIDAADPTSPDELRARLGLGDGPVVLCVAQKRRYKAQDVLVHALPELDGAVLVLPGAQTPFEAELRDLAGRLGVADRVRFLDWVGDADLEGLYALAACVALPTRYEGFGLPVLEAMARGAPVACSDRSSLPEVAGDAAVLFDPDDGRSVVEAIREAIARRDELGAAGRERAARFTWERCAEGTVAAYRRALAR